MDSGVGADEWPSGNQVWRYEAGFDAEADKQDEEDDFLIGRIEHSLGKDFPSQSCARAQQVESHNADQHDGTAQLQID